MHRHDADTPWARPVVSPPKIYAGFWKRALAFLIDSLIMVPANIPLGLIAGYYSDQPALLLTTSPFLLSITAAWLYVACLESSSKQATLGKMMLGIKVVSHTGGRLSFGQATGRHFSKIISGLTLYIGFFMAGWTERKQALHDKICDTLVVNKNAFADPPAP